MVDLEHLAIWDEPGETICKDAAAEIAALRAEIERLTAAMRTALNTNRDELGRMVREAWVRWAETQPSPKPTWLVPYEQLSEPDKEADRQIGEAVARWTMTKSAERQRSKKALYACAWWLRTCLDAGWPKDMLDTLERIWWQYHDDDGELIR